MTSSAPRTAAPPRVSDSARRCLRPERFPHDVVPPRGLGPTADVSRPQGAPRVARSRARLSRPPPSRNEFIGRGTRGISRPAGAGFTPPLRRKAPALPPDCPRETYAEFGGETRCAMSGAWLGHSNKCHHDNNNHIKSVEWFAARLSRAFRGARFGGASHIIDPLLTCPWWELAGIKL